MDLFSSIILWLHFIGFAMAMGGGIGVGIVGPRLVAATAVGRQQLWALEDMFDRVAIAGLIVLVITGPLMLWLLFGGMAGLSGWFALKMLLVLIALVGAGVHRWAGRRFHGGEQSAAALMIVSGRIAGAGIALAALCAVLAFS